MRTAIRRPVLPVAHSQDPNAMTAAGFAVNAAATGLEIGAQNLQARAVRTEARQTWRSNVAERCRPASRLEKLDEFRVPVSVWSLRFRVWRRLPSRAVLLNAS